MEILDTSKTIYLYDDRSKNDCLLKVSKIVYQDDEYILCKTVVCGHKEIDGKEEKELLLIDLETGEVKNSDYYSWLATTDEKWAEEKIEHYQKMNE